MQLQFEIFLIDEFGFIDFLYSQFKFKEVNDFNHFEESKLSITIEQGINGF